MIEGSVGRSTQPIRVWRRPLYERGGERHTRSFWFIPWHTADLFFTNGPSETLLCWGPVEVSLLSVVLPDWGIFFLSILRSCWVIIKSHCSAMLPASGLCSVLFVQEFCLWYSPAPASFFCLPSLNPFMHLFFFFFFFFTFYFFKGGKGKFPIVIYLFLHVCMYFHVVWGWFSGVFFHRYHCNLIA